MIVIGSALGVIATDTNVAGVQSLLNTLGGAPNDVHFTTTGNYAVVLSSGQGAAVYDIHSTAGVVDGVQLVGLLTGHTADDFSVNNFN